MKKFTITTAAFILMMALHAQTGAVKQDTSSTKKQPATTTTVTPSATQGTNTTPLHKKPANLPAKNTQAVKSDDKSKSSTSGGSNP